MFLAGASTSSPCKLLTTPNPEFDSDTQLFELPGLEGTPHRTRGSSTRPKGALRRRAPR